MRLQRFLTLALLGVGLGGFVAETAKAEIIVRDYERREIGDPIFEYEFDLFLVPGSAIVGDMTDGDFITFYDIPFLASVVQGITGFADDIENEGRNPDGMMPPGGDNPNITNITFQYFFETAPIISNGPNLLFLGTLIVQTFNIPEEFAVDEIVYGWQTTKVVDGMPTGEKEFGFGTTVLIPEPASILSLAAGLGLSAGFVVRRRRRTAAA